MIDSWNIRQDFANEIAKLCQLHVASAYIITDI